MTSSFILWGDGERHASGKRWDPEEWARFKAWALKNGALQKDWSLEDGEDDEEDLYWFEEYERLDGTWTDYGTRHRVDGPAIIGMDGYEAWYLYGQRHREDGPAITEVNGTQEWWVSGHRISRTCQ